jgi:y4mF family transcriptional regulator
MEPTPRDRPATDDDGRDYAQHFGELVRERRKALGLSQDDLALSAGVGRRFVVDLEAGKPTLQLGRALVVAEAVGLRIFDLLTARDGEQPLLPPMEDGAVPDDEEPIS